MGVVILALAFFNWIEVRRLVDSAALVLHTHQVQGGVARLFSLVQDVELGQRGFLVTGDAAMLRRYESARVEIEQEFQRIHQFTRDDADQDRRLRELELLIRQRMEMAGSVLRTLEARGMPAAQQEIATGGGAQVMEATRHAVAVIQDHEQALLEARTDAARRSAAVISVAVPLGFGIALVALAISFLLSRKANRALTVRVEQRTGQLHSSRSSLRGEVTERKDAEASLRESEAELRQARDELERRVIERTEELERSNYELEQFAYVASHDLQEPLRAISGCVQIIAKRYEAQLDAKGHELINHTVDGVSRMKELIDGLLAYSRVNRASSTAEAVATEAALAAAIRQLESAITESGAKIVQGELPMVRADHGQLVQLFQNLLGNALKYRGDAAPEISIGATLVEGMWSFAVGDNGIGIEPQYFQRVFSIFQRLHTRDEYPGTGIGLALCKKIVERAGGTIWIESEPGAGSTFHFTLPQVTGT
ncbi:MAG: CHASE3 domain-containing protein [Verrucomicrobiota bacterium]|nr:CHASE3 domain-containing protein [Verrucomicrobiota bacterium]